MISQPELLEDPRFKTDIDRGNNGKLLSEIMERWSMQRTCAEALEALAKAKVPAAKVLKPQETLDDPHVKAMGFFQPTEYPGMAKPAPIAKVPIWLSENQGTIRHRAPKLGEHTDQIMAGLGYDKAAIAALREKGVI